MRPAAIDIGTCIEECPFDHFQILVVGLCGLVALIDGFDAQIMGFAPPLLSSAFQISRSGLGPVFSAGLPGMMTGFAAIPILLSALTAFCIHLLARHLLPNPTWPRRLMFTEADR